MSKFCISCGKPLADDAKFCGSCGTKVIVAPVQAKPVQPQPVQQKPVQQPAQAITPQPLKPLQPIQPVQQQAVQQHQYQQAPSTPNVQQRNKPKGNKGLIIFVSVIVVVVGFFAFRTVKGWFDPNTEPSTEITQEIENTTETDTSTTREVENDTVVSDTMDESDTEEVTEVADTTDTNDTTTTSDTAEASTEEAEVEETLAVSWTNELFGGTFIGTDGYNLYTYSPENATYETIYQITDSSRILPDGINPIYPVICTADYTNPAGVVKLLDLETMEERTLELSETYNLAIVSWSPNGELLAACNEDKVYIYKLLEDGLFLIDEETVRNFTWTSDSLALYYTTSGYGDGFAKLKSKIMGGGVEELYSYEGESVVLEFEMENGVFSGDVFFINMWSTNTQEILDYRGIGFQYGGDDVYLYDDYRVMYEEYLEWLGLSDELIGQFYNPNSFKFPQFTYGGADVLFVDTLGDITAYYVNDVSQAIYMGKYDEFEVVNW